MGKHSKCNLYENFIYLFFVTFFVHYLAFLTLATRERLEFLLKHSNEIKDFDGLISTLKNDSNGDSKSVFNRRTIGQIFLNFEINNAKIWLLREADKGLLNYDISWALRK
jgi:hypothetical protein